MSTSSPSTRANRLAGETSPYLLQHQHNPVDWWPWGPEALAAARQSGKPILLSVGYAACHWCHVMAHESFEDEGVAEVMNLLFVNIKVDREERPDVDQIYMSALQLLGEQGGWPLTMFLTPDGEPFWGGTYFPKTARYGRPGFVDVLREVARLFREEPGRIDQNRRTLMRRLAERARSDAVGGAIGPQELDSVAQRVADAFDPVEGGLRGAPKFPQASILELLWRAGLRTGDDRFPDLVSHTLERISNGGIYDHLGGGFARYSVDEHWLVPHFEKMLYDNAQLLELLALAFARSHRTLYRERAHETVRWLRREMTTAEGAFCASLDADSEGEEGKFYVWSLGEIEQTLGAEDAQLFARFYDVTSGGNFEGVNILNRLEQPPGSAPGADWESRLAELRSKLFATRARRERPGLDDKVLADWNGLMIASLANAGVMLEEPAWISQAAHAFAFIAGQMTRGDRLGHSWRSGRLQYPGLASDFAAMIKAALTLAEATGDRTYLEQALVWQRALDRHYADPEGGGYFMSANDAEALVVRPRPTMDEATPNPNAVEAQNLIRLAILSGDESWRDAADRLFDRLLPHASKNPLMHAALLNALDFRLRNAELVVAGAGAAAAELLGAALRIPFLARTVVRLASEATLPARHPAHAMMDTRADAVAYVCVGETCSLPATTPTALTNAAGAMWPALIASTGPQQAS